MVHTSYIHIHISIPAHRAFLIDFATFHCATLHTPIGGEHLIV